MKVKEHYDTHLGFFYSWMLGDFEEKKNEFVKFCKKNSVIPHDSGLAIDLGAGNGIQSVALGELGFKVKAVDFNQTLLTELETKTGDLQIETLNGDLRDIPKFKPNKPELIICCGDTISHLDNELEISRLIENINDILTSSGKIILSFRDYSLELKDTQRFIPVKSDSNKILTCHLEYFDKKVKVTDLLHEKIDNEWVQRVSSYDKVRTTKGMITNMLNSQGFDITLNETIDRMITIIGRKN